MRQIFTTDVYPLIYRTEKLHIVLADSLGEIVFKLRLMLTRIIQFFFIKQEIFKFIMINRQFVSYHPRKNIPITRSNK